MVHFIHFEFPVTNSSLSDSADSTSSTSPTTTASWSTTSNLSTSPETEDSSDDNERQESRKKLRRRRRKKRRLHRVVAKKDFIEKKKLQLLEVNTKIEYISETIKFFPFLRLHHHLSYSKS